MRPCGKPANTGPNATEGNCAKQESRRQGIGATGFVSGEIKASEPKTHPAFWVRYAAFIQSMRDAIDQRIRAALPGDKAAIASALLTGTRDAISGPVNDAMYISSLAHVLSISGYHMAVVAA